MTCPFCDLHIIKNQTLHDSLFVRVIHNIRPANKGQCIVVPKRHVQTIRGLTHEELSDLIFTVQLVSEKLAHHLQPKGFNYGFNEGCYAGQTVEHFHFHIMPRMDGDKGQLTEYHLFHRNPKTKKNLSSEELQISVDAMKKFFA